MKVHEQNTVRPLSFITFLRFSAADRMPISICLLTNPFLKQIIDMQQDRNAKLSALRGPAGTELAARIVPQGDGETLS